MSISISEQTLIQAHIYKQVNVNHRTFNLVPFQHSCFLDGKMYEISKLISVFVISIEIYNISCNDDLNWIVNQDLKRDKRIKCYQSNGWKSLNNIVNETKNCAPNPNYGAQLCFGFTGFIYSKVLQKRFTESKFHCFTQTVAQVNGSMNFSLFNLVEAESELKQKIQNIQWHLYFRLRMGITVFFLDFE